MEHPTVIVIGGTAGTGKSTIGESLIGLLNLKYPNAQFMEGDRLHPPENVVKMSSGIPLSDYDRWDWLKTVSAESSNSAIANGGICVITCSSLKKKYRDFICSRAPHTNFFFIMIYASKTEIYKRLTRREGHFMKANMLDSQFDDLELPVSIEEEPESRILTVDGRLQNHVLLNVFQMTFELLKTRPLWVQIMEIFQLYSGDRHPDGKDSDFLGVSLDLIINELSWINVAAIKQELDRLCHSGKLVTTDENKHYFKVVLKSGYN